MGVHGMPALQRSWPLQRTAPAAALLAASSKQTGAEAVSALCQALPSTCLPALLPFVLQLLTWQLPWWGYGNFFQVGGGCRVAAGWLRYLGWSSMATACLPARLAGWLAALVWTQPNGGGARKHTQPQLMLHECFSHTPL